MYKWLFEKYAKLHIRYYLPWFSKIMNKRFEKNLTTEQIETKKKHIESNIESINGYSNKYRLFSYWKKNFKYTPDGVKGFPDWNMNLSNFLANDMQGDCDSITNLVELLKIHCFIDDCQVVSILPYDLRKISRMHVIAVIDEKVASNNRIYNCTLSEYLKNNYSDTHGIVLDYETGNKVMNF